MNQVEAVEISIELLSKFPKDILHQLHQMVEKRIHFIKKRVLEITKGLSTNEATGFSTERKRGMQSQQNEKQYPSAGKGALRKIRMAEKANQPIQPEFITPRPITA